MHHGWINMYYEVSKDSPIFAYVPAVPLCSFPARSLTLISINALAINSFQVPGEPGCLLVWCSSSSFSARGNERLVARGVLWERLVKGVTLSSSLWWWVGNEGFVGLPFHLLLSCEDAQGCIALVSGIYGMCSHNCKWRVSMLGAPLPRWRRREGSMWPKWRRWRWRWSRCLRWKSRRRSRSWEIQRQRYWQQFLSESSNGLGDKTQQIIFE